ncbi:uncharacterized protein LOC109825735 isoform X1 [Asparagus officinalis]|uniref:uncharacterized protein LOC109825735 isoform X1 n=2 Tax=Asparagus officinalis TaxID=4686 RepID=UPI00098E09B1|nr:uncharacterized protein LOC109825735 isoform X1 [Asparagus officinalis]
MCPSPLQVLSLSFSLFHLAPSSRTLHLPNFCTNFNVSRVFAGKMSSSTEKSSNDYEVGHLAELEGKGASSAGGSTEEATEATKTLIEMQKEALQWRDQKRRTTMAGRTNEPPSKKQEKIALTGSAETLRLTANIGAYWAFMKRLAPKIRQWHRDAYCGSIFQHYILFGAPAADRPTLELLLSFFDRDNNTFCIPDSKSGGMKNVSFDLQWVHNHTYFPIYGEDIRNNRDSRSRIWLEYFAKLFISEEGKKLKKSETSQRKHLEGLLERLVESTKKRDIEDFALLQILYQCSMIWSPIAGEGIPRPLLRYLDSIQRVNSVAWAPFFYNEIIRGIGVALEGKKKQKVAYVPGCMTLLCVSSIFY